MRGLNTILGAGSVGLTLGARLASAGGRVRFVVRRKEAAERLRREGLVAEDPASDRSLRLPVDAVTGTSASQGDLLFLCVRTDSVEEIAAELAQGEEPPCVVSFQNDVVSEEILAQRGLCVVGGVWRETCTRLADNHVRFTGRGRAVVGLHPEGEDPRVAEIAGRLRRAGIDTGVSQRIPEDKWLKLCVNLTSAPNALIRRTDHAQPAFVEVKARLLEEARATLRAAGIVAASCDGRDRSLDEEIEYQRSALARGVSARALPLYNQVWQSLERHLPLEADAYHRRILALAEAQGLEAPVNRVVLTRLLTAYTQRSGPECYAAEELLG